MSSSSASPAAPAAVPAPPGLKSVTSFPTATIRAKLSSLVGPMSFSTSLFRFGSLDASSLSTSSTSSAAPRSTSRGWSPNCCWIIPSNASYAARVSRVFGRYDPSASASRTLARSVPRRLRFAAYASRSS